MLNFYDINFDLEKAKTEHEFHLKTAIKSELLKYQNEPFIEFLSDEKLDKILTSEPKKLFVLNNEFVNHCIEKQIFDNEEYCTFLEVQKNIATTCPKVHQVFDKLKKIFNYDAFVKLKPSDVYSTYHLTENLGVRTCMYSNKDYTLTHTTIDRNKLMRPQLDHWFPKSKFPMLALSFYNLIPSSSLCNSIKANKVLDLDKHIHPHVKNDKDDDFRFSYDLMSKENSNSLQYKVKLLPKGKGNKHVDTLKKLKIDEMYDAHQYEIEDLIKLKQAYSKDYIDTIMKITPNIPLSEKDIYRIVFGTEMYQEDFHKKPFSKFKHDLLKELGVI